MTPLTLPVCELTGVHQLKHRLNVYHLTVVAQIKIRIINDAECKSANSENICEARQELHDNEFLVDEQVIWKILIHNSSVLSRTAQNVATPT